MQLVCDEVIILDDHSDDGTPEIAERLGCRVIRSQFQGLDESRDKDALLSEAYRLLPENERALGHGSPHWAVMIDGDEEIVSSDAPALLVLMRSTRMASILTRILYLWDSPQSVRVDGVYGRMKRPSAFRLMNAAHRFRTTNFGPNLHCSSAPHANLSSMADGGVRLLHYGYMHREDRVRKYHWYNSIDPNNDFEDRYRHTVIGDLFPATSRFRHAGPLRIEALK